MVSAAVRVCVFQHTKDVFSGHGRTSARVDYYFVNFGVRMRDLRREFNLTWTLVC